MYQDRYVPVPEGLTKPVEIVSLPPRGIFEAMSEKDRLIALEAARKAQAVRAQQCNGQLAEIGKLGAE